MEGCECCIGILFCGSGIWDGVFGRWGEEYVECVMDG